VLFFPVYASSEPRFRPRLKGGCPRTICALCIPVSVPGLARYAVLPSPAPGSGPQVLLLSKLKAPINHAESTLLKVFFLKNLKPFAINTFEKQGGGSLLWLTNCSKRVSSCAAWSHQYTGTLPRLISFACHSYENTGVWGHSSQFGTTSSTTCTRERSTAQTCGDSFFSPPSVFHFPFSIFFFPASSSSTGVTMISRTRSRSAGTSSLVRPLVSMVSCR